MSTPSPKSTILYAKMELGGIAVRPDSRSVIQKAVEGHPIEVTSGNDYINLYHVFERLQGSRKELAEHTLVRRQIGHSRWLLFVLPPSKSPPEVELQDDYDPKRGRYKRYAEQLAAGDTLKFQKKAEAIKARRAWQLYVPIRQRKHLRSTLRRVGKSQNYTVLITDKASERSA